MNERQWKRWDAIARLERDDSRCRCSDGGSDLSAPRATLRRHVEARREGRPAPRQSRGVPATSCRRGYASGCCGSRTTYRDFNDQHFTEKLRAETPPLVVSCARAAAYCARPGFPDAPPARREAWRRRERKAQAGLMLLWDGSRHDWLEGRVRCCASWRRSTMHRRAAPGGALVEQECAAAICACCTPWSRPMAGRGHLHGPARRVEAQR